MTELSGYVFELLWEDGEFILSRSVRDRGLDPILVEAPVPEQPTPGSFQRLAHSYALRDELDSTWAARPLELVRHHRWSTLLLEHPGGEPLPRLLWQPWDAPQFLWITINVVVALGRLHALGRMHKNIKPANILMNIETADYSEEATHATLDVDIRPVLDSQGPSQCRSLVVSEGLAAQR